MTKGYQSGQVLLVVVLTMIVALTVGLAIAARVVTELKISKQNEESQRAFQAAEAGVQQTLESKTSYNQTSLSNNSTFSTQFIDERRNVIAVNNGFEVDQTVGADVWLSDYSADPSNNFDNPMGCSGGSCGSVPLTMYWGSSSQTSCSQSGDSSAAAVEVVLLKGPITNPTIQKSVYESAGCTRIPNVSYGTTSGGPFNRAGIDFRNKADILFGGASLSNGLIMKVIPIFNSTVIAFESNDPDAGGPLNPYNFPFQGSTVESTGQSGDTFRKVVYFQSNPQLPIEVFPYSLISQ